MLRFESYVFVLCTVLALLPRTFAVQTNASGDQKKEDNDECNEDLSNSEEYRGMTISLRGEVPKDKKIFMEKYIILLKSLSEKQADVQTSTKESASQQWKRSCKNALNIFKSNRFAIKVSINTIFEDSYARIMSATPKDILIGYLKLSIKNEGNGKVDKENVWLYLLSKEIFNPSRKLFVYVDPRNTNGQLKINPDSKGNEDHLNHFEFVGRVFGLALFNGKRIRVNLTPSFYKRILNENMKIQEVEEQMSAFIKGLTDLIPLDELRKFNETELESLFCDTQDLDIKEWKKYTSYKSGIEKIDYKENDSIIKWFWEIIKGYNESERRKVLLYATGTDALPVIGFMNVRLPFKIIQMIPQIGHIKGDQRYKTMEIPRYAFKETLMEEMNVIIGKEQVK